MAKTDQQLPTPHQLKLEYPLKPSHKTCLSTTGQEIIDILNGKDPRLLAIVGPCSIHDTKGAIEYARKIEKLSKDVEDTLLIVMRVYFEKPRSGIGWKGLLHDPKLNGNPDIEFGLRMTRKLLLEITDLGIPVASELLDPVAYTFLHDLISWGSVGARTPESQIHRQLASGLEIPIGFKNSTDGTIESAIQAISVANEANSYIGVTNEGHVAAIHTDGNPHTHLVLRGGHETTNYDAKSIREAMLLLEQEELPQRCIVDCSHGNSSKKPQQQIVVLEDVIEQVNGGCTAVRGFMLESYLRGGKQGKPLHYDISITDACLDWNATEKAIRHAHSSLNSSIVYAAISI